MRAINIEWDVDFDDVYDLLFDSDRMSAEFFDVPLSYWQNMTREEIADYAYDYFRKSPSAKAEFLGLPTEVDIPSELSDASDDEITDYICDEVGFCCLGYDIEG